MLKIMPIDAVYTWVDGNDPAYQAVYRQYAQTPSDLNPERYRDLYTLLKYSLRSLERYAPWVREVYLFTCRPQAPAWLNTAHPRLHLIHHDTVFDPQYLPTFSCNAIESYLHALPNASPYLLYFNDDYLLGRATPRQDFLTDDGRLKVYGTVMGEHSRYHIYDGRFEFVSLARFEHLPILIYKPYWAEMLAYHAREVHATRLNKFRVAADLRMERLYRYHLLTHQRPQTQVVPAWEAYAYNQFHKITNNYPQQARQLAHLQAKRPKFYCLNDDQRDRPDARVGRLVRDLLETWYPEKSAFEK